VISQNTTGASAVAYQPIHPAIAYLEGLFDEDDFIFFQLIHSTRTYITPKGEKKKEVKLLPLVSMKKAITSEFITSLEAFQADGWNIYVSMNPFPEGTTTRTEGLIKTIRNLFLDVDKTKGQGANALQLIRDAVQAGIVPEPHSILESSPGNYHVAWAVDGFSWDEAKATLPVLASMLGGDMAAIDLHRVLRLPGFQNLKYSDKPLCNLISSRLGEECYSKPQFNIRINTTETKKIDSPTSTTLLSIADRIEQNAAEAKFELGDRDDYNGGFKWVVECPWAAVHTTGTKDALIMLLADGRPQFNCFHGHCNGSGGPHRGWSDIRELWKNTVGHHQRFGDEKPGQVISGGTVYSCGENVPPVSVDADDEKEEQSTYNMTEAELEEQKNAEYPVYKLHEGAGPSFDEGILYGPVGEVAKRMARYNESHVASIYLNLLVSFGNMFGRHAYFNVNKTEHFLNEFLACVGDSSTARKGTGGDEVDDFLTLISSDWMHRRNIGGFGSPQGIIYQIRDDITFKKLDKKTGLYKDIFKAGIDDKRLCIREGELSNILKLMSDPKTRADELLRNMWDGKKLENAVSGVTDQGENKSLFCIKPHGSIVGYTTSSLMKSTMPVGADVSGSGNRFIYAYLKRLKLVPLGGPAIDWVKETLEYKGEQVPFLVYFYEMVSEAQKDRNIPLSASTRKFWENAYLKMERQEWTGLVGRLTSRGPAHIRRLATILALIDREDSVHTKHLEAAMSIWDYSRESVRYIFVGYTPEQERILRLAFDNVAGITGGRDVHALFNRHKSSAWVKTQLTALVRGGWLSQEGDVYKFKKW